MYNLSFLPFLKIVDKTYLAMHSGLKKGWIGFLVLIIGLGLFLAVKSEFIYDAYTNGFFYNSYPFLFVIFYRFSSHSQKSRSRPEFETVSETKIS